MYTSKPCDKEVNSKQQSLMAPVGSQSIATKCSCNLSDRNTAMIEGGAKQRHFFGSTHHGIIRFLLFATKQLFYLYSTSDIFSSVFAALTPPDHLPSFFSHSMVCMALECKISALKLVRRLHFSPRASISACEGNVFSKALFLTFWICRCGQ